MKKKFTPIVLLIILLTGCSMISEKKPDLSIQPLQEAKFNELLIKGDLEFRKMHWAGWTRSIKIYRQALEIQPSEQVREKLFFACLHKAVRARFFFLPGKAYLDNAEKHLLHLRKRSDLLHLYFRVARIYILPEDTGVFSQAELVSLREDGDTDYKYMFYTLYQAAKTEHRESREEANKMLKRFPDSNLRFFLRDKYMGIDQAIKNNPDYIELLITRADLYFNTGSTSKAEKLYLKVLDIDNSIPTAFTEMGSIYTRMGLYDIAMGYYEKAIRIAPLYYKALFGKAVCLSQTGRYRESIDVLNIMISNDLWYKGETYYYRAFNAFILGDHSGIEADLKASEIYIPESLELHTLFGMFYYDTSHFKKSRHHLEKAEKLNNGYPRPWYYLGFLDVSERKIHSAFNRFRGAASRYLKMVRNNIEEIKNLDRKDLPADKLVRIRELRTKGLDKKIDEIILKLKKIDQMLKNFPPEKTAFIPVHITDLKRLKAALHEN